MTREYGESCSCPLNPASRPFWGARPKSSLGPQSPAAPKGLGEPCATWTRLIHLRLRKLGASPEGYATKAVGPTRRLFASCYCDELAF
jgi:hypothetical protein